MRHLALLESCREEDVNSLIGKAGRRVHRVQVAHRLRGAARLFTQLAPGARFRIFAGIEPAGGDFIEESVGGIAVLLDQKDLRIVAPWVAEEGNDRACTRVSEQLELSCASVRVF